MNLFWSTFLLIFVAEIADKSRVVGLLLSTTYRAPWSLFWGMTLGYVFLDGVAVLIGGGLSSYFPAFWIKGGSALIFIAIGVASFFAGARMEEQGRKWLGRIERWGPLVVSFVAISLSEMADRTQLAAAALSAGTGRPVLIFFATISALAFLNLITVAVGEKLTGRLPFRTIHTLSGIGFFLAGLFLLGQILYQR